MGIISTVGKAKFQKVELSKGAFLSGLLFAGCFIAYLITITTSNSLQARNLPVEWWLSLGAITCIACGAILMDEQPYSLNKIHWYFVLVFLGIVPLVQVGTGFYPWNFYIPMGYYTLANYVVLAWSLFYLIAYWLLGKRKVPKQQRKKQGIDYSWIPNGALAIVSVACVVVKLVLVGPQDFFSVGGVTLTSLSDETTLGSMIFRGLAAIPALAAGLLIVKKKAGHKTSYGTIGLVLLSCYLIYIPFATTRYLIGAVAIGTLLLLMPPGKKGSRYFDIVIILGLFVVFPLMSNLKFMTFTEILNEGILGSFDPSAAFASVDFDAYSMLARSIMYVDQFGLTGGLQVASALLFFIPRSLWAWKGYMTSEVLVNATAPGAQTNLSTPIMGEFYIDFSIMGVLIAAVLFGLLCRRLDGRYWELTQGSQIGSLRFCYPFFLGFMLFVCRGTLLYGVMWTTSFFLPILFVALLSLLFGKKRGIKKEKEGIVYE